jgi:hypothetical protein
MNASVVQLDGRRMCGKREIRSMPQAPTSFHGQSDERPASDRDQWSGGRRPSAMDHIHGRNPTLHVIESRVRLPADKHSVQMRDPRPHGVRNDQHRRFPALRAAARDLCARSAGTDDAADRSGRLQPIVGKPLQDVPEIAKTASGDVLQGTLVTAGANVRMRFVVGGARQAGSLLNANGTVNTGKIQCIQQWVRAYSKDGPRGDFLLINGQRPATILSIASNTSLTISSAIKVTTGASYSVAMPEYTINRNQVRPGQCLIDPADAKPCTAIPPQNRIWWDVFSIPSGNVFYDASNPATSYKVPG